jgi:hypothetical protein
MGWRNYPVHPPCSLLDRVLLSLDGVRYISFASTIFLLERGQFLISGHSFLLTKLCYLAGQYSFVPKKMLAQQFKFCYLASCEWSTLRRRLEKKCSLWILIVDVVHFLHNIWSSILFKIFKNYIFYYDLFYY